MRPVSKSSGPTSISGCDSISLRIALLMPSRRTIEPVLPQLWWACLALLLLLQVAMHSLVVYWEQDSAMHSLVV